MSRARLLLVLALLVPAGFLTKASGIGIVRGYVGGALYVVFWTYAVLLARPRWRCAAVATGAFLATCAIETLQLWHPPWLERIRTTFVGGALLGSQFDPWDFAAYAVGAVAAIAFAVPLAAPEPAA